MPQGLRHVRNAVVLALAWAAMWAPIALIVGLLIIDPDNSMDEMWPAIGAYPGFLCALVFSAVLGVTGRTLGELTLPRAGALGAVAGGLVGALPFALGSQSNDSPEWLGIAVIGAFALMSVFSGLASVLLARMTKHRQLRGATTNAA